MKLKLDAKSFVDSIAWVTKNFDAKNEKSYVKLSIDEEENEYYMSHGNINSYMKQNFTVIKSSFAEDEEKSVSLAMDGKFLSRLAGAIPSSGEVVLSKDLNSKQTSLFVKSTIGSFTIPLLTSTPVDDPDFVYLGEVNDNEFFASLSKISKVADTKNSGSQTFVGAVDLSFKKLEEEGESQINLFATDRYAMSGISLEFSPNEIEDEDEKEIADKLFSKNFLLPASYASMVAPSKGLVTDITLIVEENKYGSLRFGYSFPDGRIALFSLLDAQTFPNIDKVRDNFFNSVDSYVIVPTAEIESGIRTISSLAWEDEDVFFTITNDEFTISDRAEKNKISVSISEINLPEEATEDNPIVVKFMRSVMNSALSPVSTSKLKFGWNNDEKPLFTLSSVTEDDKVLDTMFSIAKTTKNN